MSREDGACCAGDDSWRSEFPRLDELCQAVPHEPDTFFYAIPATVAVNSLARQVYQELEADLAALDDSAWRAFKSKLLRCHLRAHGHRGYTGIHSVLYEAKGYRYLQQVLAQRNLTCDRIELVRESGVMTPDWAAMRNEMTVGLVEVKAVYESDDYSKYIYENTCRILDRKDAVVRRADPAIPAAFLAKLKSTVEHARNQLFNFPAESDALRIALLIVHFDYEQTILPENYEKVTSYLANLSEGPFRVAWNFRGLNAPGQQ